MTNRMNQDETSGHKFSCTICGHTASLETINSLRWKYATQRLADTGECIAVTPISVEDSIVCAQCEGKMTARQEEPPIEKSADERQTWLRRLKQKFIATLRKDPLIIHKQIDPEVIWQAIDPQILFDFPKSLQNQKG